MAKDAVSFTLNFPILAPQVLQLAVRRVLRPLLIKMAVLGL